MINVMFIILYLIMASALNVNASACNSTYDREDPTTIQLAMLDVIKCQTTSMDQNFKLMLKMMNDTRVNQSSETSFGSRIIEYGIFGLTLTILIFLLKQSLRYSVFLVVQHSDDVAKAYLTYLQVKSKWFRVGRSPQTLEELRSDVAPPIICRCCHRTTREV